MKVMTKNKIKLTRERKSSKKQNNKKIKWKKKDTNIGQ